MDHSLVTTGFELNGFHIVRHFGIVRGIIVRSRSIVGNIGVRYDATEISAGVTEVLCYGTAVFVVPEQGQG